MGYNTNMPFSNDPVLRGNKSKAPGAPPSISFGKNNDKNMLSPDIPPHHEAQMKVENDCLIVPTLTVIDSMPSDCLHHNWHSQLESTSPTLEFNKTDVLNVLQQGAFRVTVGP